jgi:hypothetical protein
MEYKLYRNKNELKGTCYYEFLPAKYQIKYSNDNYVFLEEYSVNLFVDLLKKVNEKYYLFPLIGYNSDQTNMLINELSKRLDEIKGNMNYELIGIYFSEEYYKTLNEEIHKYKDEIINMFEELINWLKTINVMESNKIHIIDGKEYYCFQIVTLKGKEYQELRSREAYYSIKYGEIVNGKSVLVEDKDIYYALLVKNAICVLSLHGVPIMDYTLHLDESEFNIENGKLVILNDKKREIFDRYMQKKLNKKD